MDVGADNFRFNLDTQNGLKNPVQIIRQPATTELHLDSLDRYLPSMLQAVSALNIDTTSSQTLVKLLGPIYLSALNLSGTNLNIQTSRPLTYGYYSRLALTQFSLKFQVPTIYNGSFALGSQINRNSNFYLATGTAPGTITNYRIISIPEGYYTLTQIAAAIQTVMRTYLELGAATCVAPTSPNGGFVFATGNPAVYMAVTLRQTDYTKIPDAKCARLLGFGRPMFGYSDTSAVSQITTAPVLWTTATTGPPNLLYTDYVDIVSASLTNYKDAKDTNTSVEAPGAILGRIWLTECATNQSSLPADLQNVGSQPITVTKTWTNPNWCQWSPNSTINSIDIKLVDMFGNVLPWSSTYSTEWSATLTLTE